ncbi:MAG TPA: cation transporter [Prolixibacteraceae bacterium]|nr:cation transporter [Prolixibacteraceae bacterium]
MQQTFFKISKMDCPSEERLIRMRLEHLPFIRSLSFDLPNRLLTVHHSGDPARVLNELEPLNLGTTLLGTGPSGDSLLPDTGQKERGLLWKVLAINFFFFALEMTTGLFSRSMGLVADSLDMLADAVVYGLALWAAGGTVSGKKKVARAAGCFQLLLAFAGLVELIRRFIQPEPVPVFQTMMLISFLALLGNSASFYLLHRNSSREAHMQASLIFTSNDVLANLGVIVAGALVWLTQSRYPDLIVGLLVFILVFRGALKILSLSK